MNLTIELTTDEAERLRAVAQSHGLKVEEFAHRLVSTQLPQALPPDPTLTLLEGWDREDATDNPQELAARRRDWEEVRDGLASSRLSLYRPKA